MTEVTSRYRRYIKWQVERHRTGVIDGLASMIFGQVNAKTEDRLLRHANKYTRNKSWKPGQDMSDGAILRKRSQRFVESRDRLRSVIKKKRGKRSVQRVCVLATVVFNRCEVIHQYQEMCSYEHLLHKV